VKSLENGDLAERDEIRGIQQSNMGPFRIGKASFGRKEGQNYRKIRVYTKSLRRYQKERLRRRKVRVLTLKGLSQKQIALQLGVSTRTVMRDWKKVEPYAKTQLNKEMKKFCEQYRAKAEQAYSGTGLSADEVAFVRETFREIEDNLGV
jgi:DNA-binding CsgD family transcriptional regulator